MKKNILKKLLFGALTFASCVALGSCKKDAKTVDDSKITEQDTTYKYSDYMNKYVYADYHTGGSLKLNGTWFLGETETVDSVCGSSTTLFNNKACNGGYVFTFKKNVILKSITFKITCLYDEGFDCLPFLKGTTAEGYLSSKVAKRNTMKFGDTRTVTMEYGTGTTFVNSKGNKITWCYWTSDDEITRRVLIGCVAYESGTYNALKDESKKYYALSDFIFDFE